ncbi:hypothetical protein UA08_03956 [Talaromyces atroroseus]|uniref:Uncharacterized protein n=1 Tax=Talaromyces atroroseus TaxID=1441469 RepID=A0A1Q5Q977_TALAT|nr:hypothetical protein UA08_03956 [Talaromyces atroroseus]OKL60674.1 hypothetical protein UA08_03956 [Talaromyces atroroseus]
MAETLFLCLSYIAESSHEPSESFQGNFANDYPVEQLGTKNKYESNDIMDVSSMAYHQSLQPSRWIEIFSSAYKAPQNQISTMTLPNKSLPKPRSVRDNLSFEMGESSRNPFLSHRATESASVDTGSGSASSKGAENPKPDRVDQASSSSQIAANGDIGAEGDVELDALIRRVLGSSLMEADQTKASAEHLSEGTTVLGKGKQPMRPAVIDISLLEGNIDRTRDANQVNGKGKQPVRSALEQPFSPYRIPSQERGKSWLPSSNVSNLHAACTTAQSASGQFNNEQDYIQRNKMIGHGRNGNIDSTEDQSEEDEEYNDNNDCNLDDVELNGLLQTVLNANPGSAISVKSYTSPATGQDVFLFNHGIRTRNIELVRTLILEDAEEAYRIEKYGYNTWLGIVKERKNRYDPETRQWKSILYPSQWRRHGLVLPEGQDILHQWFVRCDNKRAFGPREIIAEVSCGQDDKCEKSSSWEPESGPLIHDNSVKRWVEIDPDKEGASLSKKFYPFMKFWMIEGPPKWESPPCGLVKSRIRLLCQRHISKKLKCIGGEFTMLIDRGCALRDDIHRCDEKTVCEGYLDWVQAKLGLPVDKLTPTQVHELRKLHADLTLAYEKDIKGMGSFYKHERSEKKWKDVIYNHVDLYNMLFDWGLRTIRYPEGLSVVRAEESVIQ